MFFMDSKFVVELFFQSSGRLHIRNIEHFDFKLRIGKFVFGNNEGGFPIEFFVGKKVLLEIMSEDGFGGEDWGEFLKSIVTFSREVNLFAFVEESKFNSPYFVIMKLFLSTFFYSFFLTIANT